MSHVRAQAIVDLTRRGLPGISRSAYRVTVTGVALERVLPVRFYDVEAMTQDIAANGCIDLYANEFGPPVVIEPRRLIR